MPNFLKNLSYRLRPASPVFRVGFVVLCGTAPLHRAIVDARPGNFEADAAAYSTFRQDALAYLSDWDLALPRVVALVNACATPQGLDAAQVSEAKGLLDYFKEQANRYPRADFTVKRVRTQYVELRPNMLEVNTRMASSIEAVLTHQDTRNSRDAIAAKDETTWAYTNYRQARAAITNLDKEFSGTLSLNLSENSSLLSIREGNSDLQMSLIG